MMARQGTMQKATRRVNRKVAQKVARKGCLSGAKGPGASEASVSMNPGPTAREVVNTTYFVVLDPKNSRIWIGQARKASGLSIRFRRALGREIGAGRG